VVRIRACGTRMCVQDFSKLLESKRAGSVSASCLSVVLAVVVGAALLHAGPCPLSLGTPLYREQRRCPASCIIVLTHISTAFFQFASLIRRGTYHGAKTTKTTLASVVGVHVCAPSAVVAKQWSNRFEGSLWDSQNKHICRKEQKA